MDVIFTSETMMPKRLRTKGLLEWIRFMAKLMLHEMGHIIQANKESEKIIKEVDKPKKSGKPGHGPVLNTAIP